MDRDVEFIRPAEAISPGTERFKDLIGDRAPDPATAPLSFRKSRLRFEATDEKPNFLPSVFLEAGAAAARAVGRIVVSEGRNWRGQFKGEGWKGTAFLVAPGLLLTNNHVLNSPDVCKSATFQLNYRNRLDGSADKYDEFRLRPSDLFLTSPASGGLDYTFVAIAPEASERYGTIPMNRRAFLLEDRTELRVANIIQHPGGRFQEIVVHDNELLEDTGMLLYYLTDTDGGSSGSPIFDNNWRLIGLHHASIENEGRFKGAGPKSPLSVNEGIKMSAIASDLERRQAQDGPASYAAKILDAFNGINSAVGFFGTLGRASSADGLEALENSYQLTGHDVDVGTWNIGGHPSLDALKLQNIAALVADFGVDIWALAGASAGAGKKIADFLQKDFGLSYGWAHTRPKPAKDDEHTTSILWNSAVVDAQRLEWPPEVRPWFEVAVPSGQFDENTDEPVERLFHDYPALFRVTVKATNHRLFLVTLHLRTREDSTLRSIIASKILVAAIAKTHGSEASADWILLGDFDAKLVNAHLKPLEDRGLVPFSAEDDANGTFAFLRYLQRSSIDRVYLSPAVGTRFGRDGFFVTATNNTFPDYVRAITDRWPVVARASLRPASHRDVLTTLPEDLQATLHALYPQ